ncbi:hypothetical protein FAM15346_001390 [Propionibacterium freudenreichii]|uniref:hypothetical protein n=1 Tax=Propionibacterium freudenreichii TaxID=1744 RepID=UPI0005431DCC|nr:hypothetical protein [Propionibacterium freudenreichii]MDK9644347.1 hypothetical protein [Propionibacterium freudenreichii]CEG85519.1 Putative uncharacterized protein [Propionibacterium freudenreichii]CEI24633.1 Putative uncharacterized protein [Propionibacterium freudenreichii]
MAMIQTAEVFTPAELPRITDVARADLTKGITHLLSRKGYISLTGATKLGKTTFVRSYLASLPEGSWSTYIPGQSLKNGATDLWLRLAQELEIPTSKESGLANGDKSTWGFLGRLKIGLWGAGEVAAESNIGGEHSRTKTTGEKFTVVPEQAVTEALGLIRANSHKVVIAIDDFHFILDADNRQSIIVALRPLVDLGCKTILSTILGGDLDPAFKNTNTGGRRKSLVVKPWEVDELKEIATKGFHALHLRADPKLIEDLAEQSFGSPQIMQQLCLDLCEVENNFSERSDESQTEQLHAPADREAFFRSLDDDEAMGWLRKLAAGPNPRKKRRRRQYPTTPPVELDGYQLILHTIHEMGSPTQIALVDLKRHVGDALQLDPKELNKIALEQKARNLGEIAARDTTDALQAPADQLPIFEGDDEDESSEEDFAYAELIGRQAIPQPVFEVKGQDREATISILDPLFQYMLKWHPEAIITGGRT